MLKPQKEPFVSNRYLRIPEDDMIPIRVDKVEEIISDSDNKPIVRVYCRECLVKGKGDDLELVDTKEEYIKDSRSANTWGLLKDYSKSAWPKEGVVYWAWKDEDAKAGIRWTRG